MTPQWRARAVILKGWCRLASRQTFATRLAYVGSMVFLVHEISNAGKLFQTWLHNYLVDTNLQNYLFVCNIQNEFLYKKAPRFFCQESFRFF